MKIRVPAEGEWEGGTENGGDLVEGRRPAGHQLTVLLDQIVDGARRRDAVAGSLIAGPAPLRSAIVSVERFGEMLPEPTHHSFRNRLRRNRVVWKPSLRSDVPPDRETGLTGGEGSQAVVEAPIRDVSPQLGVPTVRWMEGDDRSVPLPAVLRLRQILEHSPFSTPLDDLALVCSLLQRRILRRIVREPTKDVR